MSLNNKQMIERTNTAASKLLKVKGYVSAVDVLMEIGKLSKQDYENWRHQKVPYLEKVIKVNLSKINLILRTMQKYSQNDNLKSSKTVYKSWGKGAKKVLRFSKSGDQNIENAYATHIVSKWTLRSQKRGDFGEKVATAIHTLNSDSPNGDPQRDEEKNTTDLIVQ